MTKMSDAAKLLMSSPDKEVRFRLGQTIKIIASNAANFDEFCQVNIQWIGSHFVERLSQVRIFEDDDKFDDLVAMTYRIVVEYDASVKNDLSLELRAFMSVVTSKSASMSKEAREQIDYARQEMPIAILKRMLNSDELGNLRNVSSVAQNIEQKYDQWNTALKNSEEKATRLGEILEKHTQAFNFVGLHEGFADLLKHITVELRIAQTGIAVFGLLVLFPSALDLWLALFQKLDLSTVHVYTLIAASVGTVAMTLLFLYFFRIALRKADSCRAQILQIRLRMSLCRFIQSYADYSTEIKGKNADALTKFETLIFSGIVGTEDKLPSTFDGIEQLSALAKSVRGK